MLKPKRSGGASEPASRLKVSERTDEEEMRPGFVIVEPIACVNLNLPRTKEPPPYHGDWLLILPPLAVVGLVLRWAVDVPFWDQWDFLPLLDRYLNGTMAVSDLLEFHNEHILLFPKILFIIMARLSAWNILWELAANIGIVVLTAIVIRRHIVRALPPSRGFLPVLLSFFLLFSFNQFESWLWGWSLVIFLSVGCSLVGLTLLSDSSMSWKSFWISGGLGILSAFSFGTGLLYWIIGLPLVWRSSSSRHIRLVIWALLSALCFAPFVSHWLATSSTARFTTGVEWGQWVLFLPTFLGAAIINCHVGAALTLGTLGLLLYLSILGRRILRPQPHETRTSLWIFHAWIAFTLLSGLLIGLGRSQGGHGMATTSRYATIANPFWIGLMALLTAGANVRGNLGAPLNTAKKRGPPRRHLLMLALFVSAFAVSSWRGSVQAFRHYHARTPARSELRTLENRVFLGRLYPDDRVVKSRVPMLRAHRLSVFRSQSEEVSN